jgi:CHAT domain-containing protein
MHLTRKIYFVFLMGIFLFTFHSSGQPGETIQDSIKAVELFRKAVEHGRNMDPEKSLDYFRQSLEFRRSVFGEKHYRLGSTYMGMAIQFKNLYQLDNAYRYYRIAEEMYLYNAPENDSRLGDIYSNIGNYFRIKGNYAEAIRYHLRAISIYETSKDISSPRNFVAFNYNLAECYHLSNREEEALQILNRYYEQGSFDQKIQYANLKASIHFSLKNFDTSKSIVTRLVTSILTKYGQNDYDLADQYIILGQFFLNVGQQDSGLVYMKKAEPIYERYDNNERDLGDLYRLMASAWAGKTINSISIPEFQREKSQNLNIAIDYYYKALKILNDSIGSESLDIAQLEKSNFPVSNLQILTELGSAWQQLAYLHKEKTKDEKKDLLCKALNAFTTASDLAIQMRTSFISQESKMLFADLQRSVFSYTISTAYELHNLTGQTEYFNIAFENAGRAKAASLFDNLAEMQARDLSLIPDSLVELENRYNSNLAYYRERLFDEKHSKEKDSARIEEFSHQIFVNEQNRNDLRAYLERNFSEYYDLKYKRRQMPVSELQKKLKRNEALLEFVINPEEPGSDAGSIYVFAVNKNRFQIRKEPFNEETLTQIELLQKNLSSTQFLNEGLEGFTAWCEASWYVYRKLMEPSHEIFRNKRLTIVPDGILNYLPFEALLTQKSEAKHIHYHNLPYLILEYPVNYAYSTELYIMGSRQASKLKKQILAFAPDYSTALYPDESITRLAVIPGILEEVRYLGKLVGARSFQGLEATEANFRENAANFDILHLAMHTLINDSLPMFSRLAFYPVNDGGLHNDGWLNTSDIYNMEIKARMAVLSACNTGSGMLRKGEGVVSLARAFLYAGCPSVVMTLWDVEDRSGTEIMKEFYRNLKNGKTKDNALRQAKLMHLNRADPVMSHPHFWLGYITIGQTESLFPGNEIYFFGTIIVIALLLIIDQVRKKLARRKQTS